MPLSKADKRVVNAFLDKRSASGTILESDGSILRKTGFGSEKVATWSSDGELVDVSSHSSKSDEVIFRYFRKRYRVLQKLKFVFNHSDRAGFSARALRERARAGVLPPDEASRDAWRPAPDDSSIGMLPEDLVGDVSAVWDGQRIGYLYWNTTPDGKYYITSVEVAPSWRRKGVASAMYKAWMRHYGIRLGDLAPTPKTSQGKKFRKAVDGSLPNPVGRDIKMAAGIGLGLTGLFIAGISIVKRISNQ